MTSVCIMYIYNRRTHTHSTHTHTRTHIRTHTPLLFFKNTREEKLHKKKYETRGRD